MQCKILIFLFVFTLKNHIDHNSLIKKPNNKVCKNMYTQYCLHFSLCPYDFSLLSQRCPPPWSGSLAVFPHFLPCCPQFQPSSTSKIKCDVSWQSPGYINCLEFPKLCKPYGLQIPHILWQREEQHHPASFLLWFCFPSTPSCPCLLSQASPSRSSRTKEKDLFSVWTAELMFRTEPGPSI